MRLKLNLQGFRDLRTCDPVKALLMQHAERVARNAGEGFEAKASPSKNRARAVVVPTTPEAAASSARDPQHLIGALTRG